MQQFLIFPMTNDTSRKIVHMDMDAFYAQVEERDHPELKGKPLVIAKHPKETRGKGVVTTANYAARQFGIHSAMSAQKAYELCPQAVFMPGDFDKYRAISRQIHEIFHRYTDQIEPVAFDEAYLDVTENKKGLKSAIKVARLIQEDIWQELHLTSSAGVSYNKFLAKLASDYQKPAGMTIVLPDEAEAFLKKLKIEKFQGIGRKSVPKMHDLGIFTGEDLYHQDEMFLIQHFGKMGYSLYRKVRGIDNSPVRANRERKSVGKERTYSQSILSIEEVTKQLRFLSHITFEALRKSQKHGKTVVLKVRYLNFETVTKRLTLPEYINDENQLYFFAQQLFDEIGELEEGIRLLGVTVTALDPLTFENIVLPLYQKKGPSKDE